MGGSCRSQASLRGSMVRLRVQLQQQQTAAGDVARPDGAVGSQGPPVDCAGSRGVGCTEAKGAAERAEAPGTYQAVCPCSAVWSWRCVAAWWVRCGWTR